MERTYHKPLERGYIQGDGWQGSAFDIKLERQVDCIITSPPFYGTTDFLRQNRIRLWFCGWDYLRQREEKEGGDFMEFRKTMDGYTDILVQFQSALKRGGVCVMHMGVVRNMDMS